MTVAIGSSVRGVRGVRGVRVNEKESLFCLPCWRKEEASVPLVSSLSARIRRGVRFSAAVF